MWCPHEWGQGYKLVFWRLVFFFLQIPYSKKYWFFFFSSSNSSLYMLFSCVPVPLEFRFFIYYKILSIVPCAIACPPWLSLLYTVVCIRVQSLPSCLTLCNPIDCSPLGSSVHGSLQPRILGRVAISSSRGSFPPKNQTRIISYVSCMISVFWMLSFKPTFSLPSFILIKRLFSSSSFSAVRLMLSAYLRLLIFLRAVLIPACNSSSPAFHMMYSAHK